ncbi:MAG: helix-turn-helix domain-containing protein [Pseudomonadota bacterium]
MSTAPYGLICPITHACEILEPRWTIPIITELWNGSTKFNEIKRGVGHISPALLSKRLKEMEENGLVEREIDAATGQVHYFRTARAVALEPALNALGAWAQCNIEARAALDALDVSTMMWQLRAAIDTNELPNRQVVIQFHFADPGLEFDTYWALIRPKKPVEMCSSIPDFDIDLYIETDRVSFASLLLSRTTIEREESSGRLFLSGDAAIRKTIGKWLYHRTKERREDIKQLEDLLAEGPSQPEHAASFS